MARLTWFACLGLILSASSAAGQVTPATTIEVDVAGAVAERIKQASSGKFSNVRTLDVHVVSIGETTVGEVTAASIPIEVRVDKFVGQNCTKDPQKRDEQLSFTTEEGITVQVTQALHLSQKFNLGFNIKGLVGGVDRTESIDITQSSTESRRVTKQLVEKIERTIPPKTELVVIAERSISHAYIPFTGQVIVDGEAEFELFGLARLKAPISRIIPDPQLRTFTASGRIWNSTTSSLKVRFEERSLSAECAALQPAGLLVANSPDPDIAKILKENARGFNLLVQSSSGSPLPSDGKSGEVECAPPRCEYNGVCYNEGAKVCVEDQLCACRDSAWDVVKSFCE